MISLPFSAILDLLNILLSFTHPADAVLSRYFRDHPDLGKHDRQIIADTLFDLLRHLPQLAWIISKEGISHPTTRQQLLAYFIGVRQLNIRELPTLFDDKDRVWAAQLKAHSLKHAPLTVRAALLPWITDALSQSGWSDLEMLTLGQALLLAAPLDLRMNTFKEKNRAIIIDRLAAAGIDAEVTPWSPWGLRVSGKPAINKTKVFEEGLIEIQDEGSQLVGLLTKVERGQMVVDFCAGSGGKTLLLGAMMHSTGRIYAFDVSEKRLAKLKPRLARSGLSNVWAQRIDSENDLKVKRLAGKIDVVLADVPCSGLGTLRRNPDLKYRQTPESLAELNAKQANILLAASRLVKPHGRLIYASCSFLRSENEAIVEAFLANNVHFKLCDAREQLPSALATQLNSPYLKLQPHRHGTDGFFAALIERVL